MEGPLGEWMDYDLGDSLRNGPGCGTAGDATDVDSLGRSVVRHHLPQLLEEVLDEDEPSRDPSGQIQVTISIDGNTVRVPLEPRLERQQIRVQPPREPEVSHAAVIVVEVPFELEHVAQILSTRKAEASIDLR